MKIWKRILAALLILGTAAAMAGIPVMASDRGDKNILNNRAMAYLVDLFQYKDQGCHTDLMAGTLVEYVKDHADASSETVIFPDGEERTLDELCRNLEYYRDRVREQDLRRRINSKTMRMEHYELRVDTTDTLLEGDYCRVDLYAWRSYYYPHATIESGEGDQCHVSFVRIDGTWYLAEWWIEGFESIFREDPDRLRENVEYMDAHFDELCRQAELDYADSNARSFHDTVIPPMMVKIAQTVKRTMYQELGIRRKAIYS